MWFSLLIIDYRCCSFRIVLMPRKRWGTLFVAVGFMEMNEGDGVYDRCVLNWWSSKMRNQGNKARFKIVFAARNQQQDVHKVFVEMRLRKQWEARVCINSMTYRRCLWKCPRDQFLTDWLTDLKVFNGSIYNHKMDCCADWFNGSEVFVKLGNGLTGVLLSLVTRWRLIWR